MKLYLLIIFSFIIAGCVYDDTARQIKRLVGHNIDLNFDLVEVESGIECGECRINDSIPKLIVYFDSTECSSCRISELNRYNDMFYQSLSQRHIFRPIVIFAPLKNDMQAVKNLLEYYAFPHTIYLDKDNCFYKCNKSVISNDKRLHTFLTDEANNIILAGNPIGNSELMELYYKTIDQLTLFSKPMSRR